MAQTLGYRAVPTPVDAREDPTENERRFRAALEETFAQLDRILANAGLDGGLCDCCGNIDGGEADTNFGGIYCPIDGGDASGAANSA